MAAGAVGVVAFTVVPVGLPVLAGLAVVAGFAVVGAAVVGAGVVLVTSSVAIVVDGTVVVAPAVEVDVGSVVAAEVGEADGGWFAAHAAMSARAITDPRRFIRIARHDSTFERLVPIVADDNHSWVNGDSSGYEFADESSSIMGAFGGSTVGASAATPGQRRAVSQFLEGSGTVELVNCGVSNDVVWLAIIERNTVRFAGVDEPYRWDLRVTEVFRREGATWVRTHRHADPLAVPQPTTLSEAKCSSRCHRRFKLAECSRTYEAWGPIGFGSRGGVSRRTPRSHWLRFHRQ